jgi:hypothetical protein
VKKEVMRTFSLNSREFSEAVAPKRGQLSAAPLKQFSRCHRRNAGSGLSPALSGNLARPSERRIFRTPSTSLM